MLKIEIERLWRMGFNPFRMRFRCRRFKPERRWINMPGGKMIQVKLYPHKIRKEVPYNFPSRPGGAIGLRQIYHISRNNCLRKTGWWRIKPKKNTDRLMKSKILLES